MARPPSFSFAGATAIVTGGASGIGQAVASALLAHGASVVLADIDQHQAEATARDLGARSGASAGQVTAEQLDVRDPVAFADLVERVASAYVHIDYLFNNAGIAVGGDAKDLTLDHWDRVIDVNLRGVVHGVAAVYPRMVRQGSGHIVNTASLAGLIPSPTLTPYATTKHAVVGLSTSLRAEAAAYGVKVTAICPGFVDTPMLDRVNVGLPSTGSGEPGRDLLGRLPGKPYPPDALAADILAGVARNRALVVAPASARAVWRAYRASPAVVLGVAATASPRILRRLRST